MKDRRPKLRSRSQRIGELGENIFRAWAVERSLSPTKPESDYGIDFFCSVFCRADGHAEAMTGAVLSVQVRSTEKEGAQRVVLDRADAETALRIDGPYVLVSVDTASKQVRFRFMDEEMVAELHEFLQGDHDSRSWTFASMEAGDDRFAEQLASARRPAFQKRLRWVRAKLNVAAVVPGSRLSFIQDEHRGVVLVETPFITNAFIVVPAKQDEAARVVFEEGRPPDDPSLVSLRPEILALGDLVEGQICLTGPLERQGELTVEGPGFPPITIPAGIRMIGDEFGYVLRTGLYLIISEVRQRGDLHVHEFKHGIAKAGAAEMNGAGDELLFLKGLREDSSIRLDGGSPIPVSHWGNLKHLGHDLEALEDVFNRLGFSLAGLYLAEAVQPELLMTTGLIHAFLTGTGFESICPGFVYEDAISGDFQDRNWAPCGFRVPIVMNLGTSGVVIWVVGEGSVYKVDHQICGFRAERQERWDIEKRERPFAGVTVPELWFYRAWPAIPLDIYQRGRSVSLQYRHELPFDGEVYDLSDPIAGD